jgi:hypothetical protein
MALTNNNGYAICNVDLNERQTKVIYNLLCLNYLIFSNEFVSGHKSQMNLIDRKINESYQNTLVDDFFIREARTTGFSSLPSDKKLNTLRIVADKYLLELEQFSWIDVDNTRLCYFVFLWVKGHTVPTANNQNFTTNLTNIYCTLAINQSPNGNKEMKRAIQDFFDLYRIDLNSKHQLLSNVKHAWNTANGLNYFSWIDKKNLAQCEWALKYLQMHTPAYRYEADPISDKYGAFIAMTDIWPSSSNDKELLSRQMQDAWKEFNKKAKRVTKNANRATQVNIELTGDLEIKFEYLKARKNITKNTDVLRRLIEEEHERLNSNKQQTLPFSTNLTI